ncbi:MAG TPA: NnrS family protein, partial [Alphaproteobacteria bacterium]|nr:NnrS family protein [Alphaproteobacteria bacterium]
AGAWAGFGVYHPLSGIIACAAAGVHLWRMRLWHGAKALGDPMLWVLHLGYAWLVFALGLFGWVGLSEGGLSSSVALHALTVGAVGTMTIGMMVRVALGHTGRALEAGIGGTIPFLLVQGAAVFRLIPGLVGFLDPFPWLVLSSVCWAGAFAVYLIFFTRILFTPRPDGQEA